MAKARRGELAADERCEVDEEEAALLAVGVLAPDEDPAADGPAPEERGNREWAALFAPCEMRRLVPMLALPLDEDDGVAERPAISPNDEPAGGEWLPLMVADDEEQRQDVDASRQPAVLILIASLARSPFHFGEERARATAFCLTASGTRPTVEVASLCSLRRCYQAPPFEPPDTSGRACCAFATRRHLQRSSP